MNECKLKTLQCPQSWGFDKYKSIEECLKKEDLRPNTAEYISYAEEVCTYKYFCLLSFEAYRNKSYDEALIYLNKADVTDDFIKKYSRVFKHVLHSSRTYIFYAMKLFEKAEKIADVLNNQEFSEEENAVFDYIKYNFLTKFNCKEIIEENIHLIESATKTVPHESEFHYLLGYALGRIRRYSYPPKKPSNEEINSLKQAWSLKTDSFSYAIALAKVYMDNRFEISKGSYSMYIEKTAEIYRKLLEHHQGLSGNNIARCVYSLMKIKVDPNLEKYAEIAKQKSDSCITNHYIGLFYLQIKQYDKALECLEKCVTALPYCISQVLLLVYRINGNCIDKSEVENLVQKYKKHYELPDVEANMKKIFWINISQFYLIVMADLKSASWAFLKAAEFEITHVQYINIVRINVPYNYFSLLKYELSVCRQDNKIILMAKEKMASLPREITRNKKEPILLRQFKRELF